MKKILLIIILAFPFSFTDEISLFDFLKADYFVDATNGDDNNSGSYFHPWQTLDKVETESSGMADNTRIALKRDETIYGSISVGKGTLKFKDYGKGAKPVISGFTVLNGFTNEGNIWTSNDTIPNVSRVNMVVIGGVNTPMGREPDSGYWYYTSHSGNTQITSTSLIGATDWTGAEVALDVLPWTAERALITGHNTSTGAIDFSQYESFTISADGYKFIIQNDIKTLDTQNEWYWNPTTKKLSIYSTTEPTNVKVSSIDVLFNVASKSNVSVRNIAFEGANMQAVKLDNADYAIVSNCDIEFTGLDAIYGGYGGGSNSDSVIVENCTINESNNGAIGFPYHFVNAIIRYNTITNSGMIYGSTAIYTTGTNTSHLAYGINAKGEGTHIHHNRVTNTGYNGIQYRNSNSIIEYNYVNTFCVNLTDGGGIYSYYGDASANLSGIIVRYNLILNGHEANGIYFDDRQNNTLAYGNYIANCDLSGVYFHNNWDIIFRENYIYNSGRGLFFWASQGATYPTTAEIKNNKVVCRTSDQYNVYMGYTQYITLNIDSNVYVRPLLEDNLFYTQANPAASVEYNFTDWKTYISDDASSVEELAYPVDNMYFTFNPLFASSDTTLTDNFLDASDNPIPAGTLTREKLTFEVLMDTITYIGRITNDAIAHWKLDANSTTQPDEINGYDLTDTDAGTVPNQTGHIGQSVLFNSTGDDLSVPVTSAYPSGSAFSISAWINPVGITTNHYIASCYPGSGVNFYFRVTSAGALQASVRNSDDTAYTFATSDGVITTGNWYHVVLVVYGTGNSHRIYIDGNLSKDSGYSFVGTLKNTGTYFTIGNQNETAAAYFNGYIDDVWFVDRALTDNEISYLSSQ